LTLLRHTAPSKSQEMYVTHHCAYEYRDVTKWFRGRRWKWAHWPCKWDVRQCICKWSYTYDTPTQGLDRDELSNTECWTI